MNSCRSTLLSAWAPPFRMFIMGAGSTYESSEAAPDIRARRPIDRLLSGSGGGPGSCHRHTEQRIRAKPALGGCAVEFDERGVDASLIELPADEHRGDLAVHVCDRLANALALITFRVTVSQFERFTLTGRCPGRHGRPPNRASRLDVRFDGRIASRIENLSRMHARNFHEPSPEPLRHFRRCVGALTFVLTLTFALWPRPLTLAL